MTARVKIVVTVPPSHADAVRIALGDAGAGTIGEYTHCSVTHMVTGRFMPGDDADPFIGSAGELEAVIEERIEVQCDIETAPAAIAAMRAAHPYEEPAYDIYPLLDL